MGKRNVRLNALKHGFYAHELTVSKPDQRDFDMLTESLRVQLAPRSALQDIGFEQVVTCCWRCKLAIRLEMRRLREQFTAQDQATSNDSGPPQDIRHLQWYGASRLDLRNGMRILKELRQDISDDGPSHLANWKDQIMQVFGPGFYEALSEWKDVNITALIMAEHLQRHAETFKMPLPEDSTLPAGPKLVPDPKQKLQMMLKLIDLQAQHLSDLHQINSEASQMRQTASSEFASHYFATASRDLQRAVDWYLYLRSKEL
jgi:hypothetical protein